MDNIKLIGENGVALLWTQILLQFVRKEEGKGLSTNDLTNELLQKIQSAGTSNFDGDYNSLTGQPQINGIALTGNKTLEELGITKAITDAIGNVTQISFEVIGSFADLPIIGEVGVFYLTPNNGSGNNNYDEWIWNEKNSMYELIGSIQNKIDLSEYVKRADAKAMIDNNTYSFTESEKRNNIVPSDPIKVILGKIMKWFSDLSAGAASSLLGQNLTSGKVLVSDDGGKVVASTVDASKVGFLSGVTEDVQEQINELNSTLEGNYVYTSVSSTISFADAFRKTDVNVGNMPLALDALEKSIANYESGIHTISGGTQSFFVFFCKRTHNTYAGIIMTYYGYTPAFFSRATGGFNIFVPVNAS